MTTPVDTLRTYANGILVQTDPVHQANVDLVADILAAALQRWPGVELSWRVPAPFAAALVRAENDRRAAQRRAQPALGTMKPGDRIVLLGLPGVVTVEECPGDLPWLARES